MPTLSQAKARRRTARRPAAASRSSRAPRRAAHGAAAARLELPYTIHVQGLAARAILGVRAEERRKRQDVVVDLVLGVASRAGATDRLGDAVDYKRIKDDVLELVEGSRFRLVEALAQAIASLCLERPGVHAVEVTVGKPGALRFARSVAVTARRQRTGEGA